MADDWKPGDPIGYIRPEIPDFELPPYRGERYRARVPDTLDVAERAAMSLHCMTEVTDPLADYEVYWGANFRRNPAAMGHNSWQGPTIPKFMWGVTLNRLMCGSDLNLHVERTWMEVALKSQGPDGLIYTPIRGRPWGLRGFQVLGQKIVADQLSAPFGNAGMLSVMSHYAKRDPGPVWRDAVRRVVDGLIDLALDAGDFAYFWPSCIYALKDRPADHQVPRQAYESEGTIVPHGLVHAYRLLGYEPALTLAGKLITYLRRNFYAPDGTFWSTPGDRMFAHFHAHARGILAMAEYAETANDQEVMEFVLRCYNFAKDAETNCYRPAGGAYDIVRTPGGGLIGYFPEWTGSPQWEQSEICEVTDMVATAMRLSEAGVGDYWDDADRWIRNMLVEGQMLRGDWVEWFCEPTPPRPAGPHETTDRVVERNLGGFGSHAAANDFVGMPGHQGGIAHCCTANGAKSLYWVWDRILRHQDGKLRVNLLLNRASRWADVASYIPYQGRVDVKVKQPVDLSMRIPEWVKPAEARCQVNGADRSLEWDGRYARVGQVKPGDVAVLTFPIFERTDTVDIEKQRFKLVRKGNDVVDIDPPGQIYPLHQRPHYRSDEPRWREVTRFVSDETIRW